MKIRKSNARALLLEIRDELIAIANSDAQMGCYDLEHLLKIQQLVEQTIVALDSIHA